MIPKPPKMFAGCERAFPLIIVSRIVSLDLA